MLKGAAIFLLIGLVAALLGFTTIAGASFAASEGARRNIFPFYVFLTLLSACALSSPTRAA